MGRKPRESPASSETPTTLASTEVSERWSVNRKTDLAMPLLRGETLHSRVPWERLRPRWVPRIRFDWDPQYVAEAKLLAMTFTPSCEGEPERNSVIERFMRTLTEPYLYQHRVDTLEQTHAIIALQPAMPRRTDGAPDAGSGAGPIAAEGSMIARLRRSGARIRLTSHNLAALHIDVCPKTESGTSLTKLR